ncbi:MAG TPA: hypothetical protein VMV09_10690, partial [Candidatus Saccharimonadales bacterium]|nr:hypothetical protein [Candidatus Saccharimonadales bacterium]
LRIAPHGPSDKAFADLDLGKDPKAVALIKGDISTIARFEVGPKTLPIATVEYFAEQRRPAALAVVGLGSAKKQEVEVGCVVRVMLSDADETGADLRGPRPQLLSEEAEQLGNCQVIQEFDVGRTPDRTADVGPDRVHVTVREADVEDDSHEATNVLLAGLPVRVKPRHHRILGKGVGEGRLELS